MPKGSNQKMKLICLARIMTEQTDEEHAITMPEIIKKLNAYGIEANRKSIYDDLELLETLGYDIIKERDGARTFYYCGSREFEIAEVKFLVDAIQSSKFITSRKTSELIKKLETLVSVHQAKQLEREVYVTGRIKNMDESIYYSIDTIHTALNEGTKISFRYFHWNVEGKKEYRRDGAVYQVSPWALCWDDENYYLVAYDSDAGILKHYRVDKMSNISLLSEKRDGGKLFKEQDKAVYTKKRFRMFDGEIRLVTLKCRDYLANVIVDQFGRDVRMRKAEDGYFTVRVDVAVSNQFFGWLCSFGGDAVVLQPEDVREKMKTLLMQVSDAQNNQNG